jgi:hypothetical protein
LDHKEFAKPPTSISQVLFQAPHEDEVPNVIVTKQPSTEQGWSSQAVSGAEPKLDPSIKSSTVAKVESTSVVTASTEIEKKETVDIPKVTISSADSDTVTNKAEAVKAEAVKADDAVAPVDVVSMDKA